MQKKMRRGIAAAAAATMCGAGAILFTIAGHAQSGPPQRDMPIDAGGRAEIVGAVTARLDRAYVFPDKAAAMGADLRARMARGEFDSIDSSDAFADRLTEVLHDDSHDAHLEVRYFEKPIPVQAPGADDAASQDPGEAMQEKRLNYGMSRVERLKGNLGYIDVHQFGRPQGAAPRIAAAMGFLADTDALVIDLRHCGGGDPETVMAFASYLYDRPTHLNDVYWRDEDRTERRWTQATVAGKRYGQSRPVYLLTSGDTFSGCEDFAYALKNNRRASLVGETTGGGAHAGSPQRLGVHFMMFVPTGRPINPVTHTDWEGVGVAPDVPVSAGKALDVAQVTALKALAAREHDAEWKAKLEERIDEID